MSEKPSYLGLLNAISVAETDAGCYLDQWATVTPSDDVFADMTQRGAKGTDDELARVTTFFLENLTVVNVNTSPAEELTGVLGVKDEVADAIRKSLHRLTLRQGVFRLLDRLGLTHWKKRWDDLYAERSTLVHGLAPQTGADYGDLAHRTVSLCGQILLKAVAAEIPQAARHVARMYVG